MRDVGADIISKIHVIRHGLRTSSSIGRKEDSQLSHVRKGLTQLGFFQFYQLGSEFKSDPLFIKCLNENKVNIYTSGKSRVVDSAKGLMKGIFDLNDKNQKYKELKFKELSFTDNFLQNSRFNLNEKYGKIITKFSEFEKCNFERIETNSNNTNNINILNSSSIFDKSIPENLHMKLKEQYSKFENTYSDFYSKTLTQYLKKIFLDLDDCSLSSGIYDFKLNKKINSEYFQTLDNGLLTFSQIKRMADFIRCNKFYEDIPIYKSEYKNFVFLLKLFLVNHYHHSTTVEDEANRIRLNNFFNEMEEIISMINLVKDNRNYASHSGLGSYNIFINHNTAIRTLIHYMLSPFYYLKLCNEHFISDDDFFTVCPKFAGVYTFEIISKNKILFYANEKSITHLINPEFLDHEKHDDNKFYLNFEKLKNELKNK